MNTSKRCYRSSVTEPSNGDYNESIFFLAILSSLGYIITEWLSDYYTLLKITTLRDLSPLTKTNTKTMKITNTFTSFKSELSILLVLCLPLSWSDLEDLCQRFNVNICSIFVRLWFVCHTILAIPHIFNFHFYLPVFNRSDCEYQIVWKRPDPKNARSKWA